MVEYIEGVEYKECKFCKEEKHYSEFNKNRSREDGLQISCRVCDNNFSDQRKEKFKSKYPAPNKAVYAFMDGNEIIYIGESDQASFRINQHFNWNEGSSFCNDINVLERKKRFKYEILWYGDNDEYRKSQEKELIKLHQPKFNTVYK